MKNALQKNLTGRINFEAPQPSACSIAIHLAHLGETRLAEPVINRCEELHQSAWVCHANYIFGDILNQVSSPVTESVGIDKKRGRLSNDWEIDVFKKAICSVGSYVP